MPKYNAILIEDQYDSAQRTIAALNKNGFSVRWLKDATEALNPEDDQQHLLVDLIVVDRKLPRTLGETPNNDVGDELLPLLLEKHPDIPVIVFSGYSAKEHMQFATGGRGSIVLRNGNVTFDRAKVFEKGQSLEFDQYVASVRDLLESFDDIEVNADTQPGPLDNRLLRRVAFEYGGASISARSLGGGLSGAEVWLCEVSREGAVHARAVLKRQQKRLQPGGFQSLCEAKLAAGTTATIAGFCGGAFCAIQQIAGESPTPLMHIIRDDDAAAAAILASLRRSLDSLHRGVTVQISIADVAVPFADWSRIEDAHRFLSEDIPSATRMASSIRAFQHGDLHPGNVLVSHDQPVLIDFDNQTIGSPLIDPIALLFGPLFHEDSGLRELDWPREDQLDDFLGEDFLSECPAPLYFSAVIDWINDRKSSNRELYALVLAYACRQLKYRDVLDAPMIKGRAVKLAEWATLAIANS